MTEARCCNDCGTTRPTSEFYRGWSPCRSCRRDRNRKWRADNREALRGYGKRYRAANKERRAEHNKAYMAEYYPKNRVRILSRNQEARLKRFGLTQAAFDALLDSQDGRCAICGDLPTPGQRLDIDHNHDCCPGQSSCGECVRGLLCRRCNTNVLGSVADDIGILQSAINYLKEHQQ